MFFIKRQIRQLYGRAPGGQQDVLGRQHLLAVGTLHCHASRGADLARTDKMRHPSALKQPLNALGHGLHDFLFSRHHGLQVQAYFTLSDSVVP